MGSGCNAARLYNTDTLAAAHDTVFYCSCFCNLMQLSYFAFPEGLQILSGIQTIQSFHGTLVTFSQALPPTKRKPPEQSRCQQASCSSCSMWTKGLKNDNNNNHIYAFSTCSMIGTALGTFHSCYLIPKDLQMRQVLLYVLEMRKLGLKDN